MTKEKPSAESVDQKKEAANKEQARLSAIEYFTNAPDHDLNKLIVAEWRAKKLEELES